MRDTRSCRTKIFITCKLMARTAKVFVALSHIFAWLMLGAFEVSNATESDLYCLKTIKASLEDPNNYLNSSWNFNNNTEGFICKFTGVDCWHPDENKVLNLRFSGMGLKGEFPRAIENCSSLTGLDLSSNKFSGPLPPDIATLLKFVTTLDLSSNNFSGEIPNNISNCSYLNVLKLDHNRLTGEIPPGIGLLNRIKTFSVSNNMLSGPVPTDLNATFTAESYANNSGLCGGPLEPCHEHDNIFDLNSFKYGFISGYVCSAVAVGFMAYYMHWVWVGKKTEKNKKMLKGRTKKKITEADQVGPFPNEKLLQQVRTEGIPVAMACSQMHTIHEVQNKVSASDRMVTRMSLTEVSEATGNFSPNNVIGLGKIGVMYRAVLPNGWFLAVKRLYDSQQLEKQFLSEIVALGSLRHNNLVPLLGFCIERKGKLLVYKYISNGNLYDWLHARQEGAKILEWSLRKKIAIGIARGLAWLHHECNFRVAHLNLSSNCILLDQNFEPKISNFEGVMFRYLKDTNSSQSNFVDSGVWELEFVKKDVYDFGIILIELITGKELIQMTSSSKSLDGSLVDWIIHLLTSPSDLYDALDKSLTAQGVDDEIFQFLRIAYTCILPFPGQMPTMLEVYYKICMVRENYGLKNNMSDEIVEADGVGLFPNEKLLQEESTEVSTLERMVTRMSFTEVSEATVNFSTNNIIGLGKIGLMYKAVLPNGWIVAVKRLYDSQQFEKQFMSELLALDRLRHNNLVPLLGFCRERKEKLLVYKYILNGNLYDWLHAREGGAKILEWSLRIKIAIGIARGLAWLHHKCNFQVVHLNLSSNCILLDQNFEPKISNFGGAIISNLGGVMCMNSKDTDSSQSNFVDSGVWELEYVKKDVYDFGIMLLELITGKEPIQMTSSSKSLDGSLVDWITHLLTSSSGLYDVLDKFLTGRGFDGEIFQFLRIACTCVQPFPGQRPTMLEVYDKIYMVGENYGLKNNMSDEIVEAEITQID